MTPDVHQSHVCFPIVDVKQFEGQTLPPEVQDFKDKLISQYFAEHRLDCPGYVIKALFRAAAVEGAARTELLEKARLKAEVHYLSAWARGDIKIKGEEVKPMSEDVKLKLREISKQKRAERKEKNSRLKACQTSKSQTTLTRGSKMPIFADVNRQSDMMERYPHIIAGTFKQDPEKEGGTVVDIKCQNCGQPRTIHAADAFIVKFCRACKGKHAKLSKG